MGLPLYDKGLPSFSGSASRLAIAGVLLDFGVPLVPLLTGIGVSDALLALDLGYVHNTEQNEDIKSEKGRVVHTAHICNSNWVTQ